MATLTDFEELKCWQQARSLTNQVYVISRLGAFARDFSLRDQIRRAAVSVMSNIAEGFERGGTNEFLHFLSIARGSVAEVRSQLYVALDEGYVDQPTFEQIMDTARSTGRLISGLMHYLQQTDIPGSKVRRTRKPKKQRR
jgi:four helix bundle protein